MPCNAFFTYLEHFFKVPSSDPLWSPKERKKEGNCKNLQQNKEKTKGYNSNNTSTHLPPLELMPCNAFFMYLEHLFKVPFSDPLWSPKQRKKGHLQKPATKKNKNKRLQCKQHFNTFTTFRAHALQCLLDVFGTFFKLPSSDPFHQLRKGNKSTSKKWTKTKKCSWKVM